MTCIRCRDEPVVRQPYSGKSLCRDHFIADLETKAKREIRARKGLVPGDRIGIPDDGSPEAAALLALFRKLTGNRRDVQVSSIPVEPGDAGSLPRGGTGSFTKIAVPTTLEETATSVLGEFLRGSPENTFRFPDTGTIPVIAPFRHIPAEEIGLYARLLGLGGEASSVRGTDPFHDDIRAGLRRFSRDHPGAPHAVLNLADALTGACGRENGA